MRAGTLSTQHGFRRLLAGIVSALFLAGALSVTQPAASQAAVLFTVTSGANAGPGTLREAAQEYREWSGELTSPATFTVQIDPSVTQITLTSTLGIYSMSEEHFASLHLVGNGSEVTEISVAPYEGFLFEEAFAEVLISGLTITWGEQYDARGGSFGAGESEIFSFTMRDVQLENSAEARLEVIRNLQLEQTTILNTPVRFSFFSPRFDVEYESPQLVITDAVFTHSPMVLSSTINETQELSATLTRVDASGNHPSGFFPEPLLYARNQLGPSPHLSIEDSHFHDSDTGAIEVFSHGAGVLGSFRVTNSSFTELEDNSAIRVSTGQRNPSSESEAVNTTLLRGNTFANNNTESDLIVLNAFARENQGYQALELDVSQNIFSNNRVLGESLLTLSGEAQSLTSVSVDISQNEFLRNSSDGPAAMLRLNGFWVDAVENTLIHLRDTQFLDNATPAGGADIDLADISASDENPITLLIERVTSDSTLHESPDPSEGTGLRVRSGALESTNLAASVINSTFVSSAEPGAPLISVEVPQTGSPEWNASVEHSTLIGGGLFLSSPGESEDTEQPDFLLANTVIHSGSAAPVTGDMGPENTRLQERALFVTAPSPYLNDAQQVDAERLQLGPLQDNGSAVSFPAPGSAGALLTALPGPDSVLLSAGRLPAAADTDQRGLPRIVNTLDVGAVERYAGILSIAPDSQVTEGDSANATVTWEGFPGVGPLAGHIDSSLQAQAVTLNGSARAGVDFTGIEERLTRSAPGTIPVSVSTMDRPGEQGPRAFSLELRSAEPSLLIDPEREDVEITVVDRSSGGGGNSGNDTPPGGKPGGNPGQGTGNDPDSVAPPATNAAASLAQSGSDSLALLGAAFGLLLAGCSLTMMVRRHR